MHCRNCNHVLWNAPAPAEGAARVCPECGTGYRIDDYEFTPGKVEFHCPSCDQAYFGTSEKGHLEPSEFQCTSCGNDVSMERCILRPLGGASNAAMLQMPLPWIEPGGLFARWWRTVLVGLKQPGQIPGMIGGRDLHGAAIQFFFLNCALSSVVNVGIGLLFVAFAFGIGPGGFRIPSTAPVAMQFVLQILQVVLVPISTYFVVICGSFLASLVTKQQGIGFRQMATIVCFSSGGFALNLIPFCGGLAGLVAWAIGTSVAVGAALPKGQSAPAVILGLVGALFGYGVVTGVSLVFGILLGM